MARGKFLSLACLGLTLSTLLGSSAASTALQQDNYEDVEEAIRVFNRGKLLHQEHQYQEAIREYQAALKLDDQNPFVHNALGLAYAALGNFREALKAFGVALQINPDLTDVYNNMGMAYAEMGQKEKAFEAFSRAVRNPTYTTPEKALYNMGSLYLEDGNYELAMMHFRRSVEKQPKFALGYRGLGKVFLQMGRPEEAESQFDRALEIAPEDTESIFNLARIHQERGELEEARNLYRRVVEVDRFSPFGQLALQSLDALKNGS
jgi:tetratricopeptide (TPR) repeat protein